MQNHRTDPETMRLLQNAGWLWLGYLAALLIIDLTMYRSLESVRSYYLINGLAAALFLVMAYWKRLHRWLGRFFLPLMLTLIAAFPLVVNHLMRGSFEQAVMTNPEGMALRQMPILFVALIIVAREYNLAGVLLFSAGTALLELLTVDVIAPLLVFFSHPQPLPRGGFAPIPFRIIDVFLYLALVRTVSFIAVGVFISQLINRLHAQQRSLAEANLRLSHYASTLENLTVSRERNRMAHELHDTLAHTLTAIAVQLETVKAYWSVDRKKAKAQLDHSLIATRTGIEETRRALKSLRAGALEEQGLVHALRQLAETAASRGMFTLDLNLPENLPALSPDVEQCIFRIAQEGLENALAHAKAKNLGVSLVVMDHTITLRICDDGTGFEITQTQSAEHFGLVGMRERASLAGGTLSVESRPGKGTTLTLRLASVV